VEPDKQEARANTEVKHVVSCWICGTFIVQDMEIVEVE